MSVRVEFRFWNILANLCIFSTNIELLLIKLNQFSTYIYFNIFLQFTKKHISGQFLTNISTKIFIPKPENSNSNTNFVCSLFALGKCLQSLYSENEKAADLKKYMHKCIQKEAKCIQTLNLRIFPLKNRLKRSNHKEKRILTWDRWQKNGLFYEIYVSDTHIAKGPLVLHGEGQFISPLKKRLAKLARLRITIINREKGHHYFWHVTKKKKIALQIPFLSL